MGKGSLDLYWMTWSMITVEVKSASTSNWQDGLAQQKANLCIISHPLLSWMWILNLFQVVSYSAAAVILYHGVQVKIRIKWNLLLFCTNDFHVFLISILVSIWTFNVWFWCSNLPAVPLESLTLRCLSPHIVLLCWYSQMLVFLAFCIQLCYLTLWDAFAASNSREDLHDRFIKFLLRFAELLLHALTRGASFYHRNYSPGSIPLAKEGGCLCRT